MVAVIGLLALPSNCLQGFWRITWLTQQHLTYAITLWPSMDFIIRLMVSQPEPDRTQQSIGFHALDKDKVVNNQFIASGLFLTKIEGQVKPLQYRMQYSVQFAVVAYSMYLLM